MRFQTHNNLNAFECMSAMQKYIRRGEEVEAMAFACELGHTSKQMASMCMNRLIIISHEDIGLADPFMIVFVDTCCRQAKEFYDADKIGKWRMMIGSAIRMLCRSHKSREGDHFQAAVGVPNKEGTAPVIPDFAYDCHTRKGKQLGRGFDFWVEESSKLVPPPTEPDPYEAAALAIWKPKMTKMVADSKRLFD